MKEAQVYKTLPLNGSENGTLKFAMVTEPYGEKSQTIVSICASIDDTQSWKIHLPLCQIKDVCKALKKSKKFYKKLSKEAKFSKSSNILIDGVDIMVDENSFTTQTFIDSSYFNIDGDPDMFRLNRDDYVKI